MYTRSFHGRGERCLANFTVCLHPHILNDCDKAWRPGEHPTPPRRQALTQPPRHNKRASQNPAPPLAQDSARPDWHLVHFWTLSETPALHPTSHPTRDSATGASGTATLAKSKHHIWCLDSTKATMT